MSQKFHLLYTLDSHPEGVPKEQVPPKTGACDTVVVLSIVYPSTGGVSEVIDDWDGRTKERLSSTELFQAWIMMAGQLQRRYADLEPGLQSIVDGAFIRWRGWMRGERKPPTGSGQLN